MYRFKAVASFVLCSTFLFCAHGTSHADVKPKGHLVVPESGYHFGAVPEGTKVKHEFELKNDGAAAIQILKIIPSCGCTAAVATAMSVQPGASEKIIADFDTSGFVGDKTRTIELATDDVDLPQVSLILKGSVLPNARLEPTKLDFGELSPGTSDSEWQRDFSVKLVESVDMTLGEVGASSKNIQVTELTRAVDKKSGSFRVNILKTAPKGDLRDRALVSLVGTRSQTINVPIIAFVRGDLKLSPATISFGLVTGSQPLERTVRLENKGRTPINILDIRSDSDALEVDSKEIQAGKIFSLRIKGDPAKIRSDLRATVTIITDHPTESEIVLNVFAILPQS